MFALWYMACSFFASTSPHPAMGSSAFSESYQKTIKSEFGYTMSSADTNWKIAMPSHQSSLIFRVFRQPKAKPAISSQQATLSVRHETLMKKLNLKSYVKRWVREYPYYGFKIANTKFFTHSGQKGFLIDITSMEKKQNLRQAIFLNDKKAVILTCADHNSKFHFSLKSCNKIIRSFRWTPVKGTQH